MKLNIRSKNLELTDSLYVYTERKLGELDKFLPQNISADVESSGERATVQTDVELSRTNRSHQKGDIFRAEVNITLPGEKRVLRAESTQEDMHLAIDQVKEEMQRILKKHKGKARTLKDKGRRKFKKLMRISELARFRKEK